MRLNRFLASCGIASRRGAEQWILEGRVSVNGSITTDLATLVNPRRDRVAVDGRVLEPPRVPTYLVLHKPPGVLTTMRDTHGRATVRDLLPPGMTRVFPVGRLDADSEGLLLFTDDGRLAFRLTHPRYQVPRTYRVTVDGPLAASALAQLREGVMLEDGIAAAESVTRLGESRTEFEIVLKEGRNREIRRMIEALGRNVTRLVRTRYGTLSIEGLRPGGIRLLSAAEAAALKKIVGLG